MNFNKNSIKINKVGVDNYDYLQIDFKEIDCPRCGVSKIKKPETSWIGKCKVCPAVYYSFWKPYPSQRVLKDLLNMKRTDPIWIYNIGAMNTGKTDVDMSEAVDFAMQNPGTTQGFLANDFKMLQRVIPESLDPFIHKDWLAKKNGVVRQSLTNGYIFENGSKFIFMPSDDENKIKSINLSRWILIEGEKIHKSLVNALSARLRQDSGVVYEMDKDGKFIIENVINSKGQKRTRKKIKQSFYAIIVEANPDAASYVFDDGLLKSKKVYHTQNVKGFENYDNLKVTESEFKYSIITATPDNPYLKKGFIEEKQSTWTEDERRQNLYGEFVSSDSLVFPEFFDNVIEPYYVDKEWPTWVALDMGVGKDPTAILVKSYDPYEEQYIYHIAKKFERANLVEVGAYLKDIKRKWNLQEIFIDPSSKQTRQLTKLTSTLTELSDIVGMEITPAKNAIEDGINLIVSRLRNKEIKIFNSCVEMYVEAQKYRYEIKKGEMKKTPITKFNHFMDTWRYMEQGTRKENIHGIISTYEREQLRKHPLPGLEKAKMHHAFTQNVQEFYPGNAEVIEYFDTESYDYED